MRKFVFWAALAASLPFCGCLDGSGALEGMIEQALCGVDCDVLEVQDSVEDRGKTRLHTYTVTYRVRETLYLKIVMGDRKAVKKLVSPEKQLTATIRVERGRAAADPAILALSDDKLLDMWLMGAAKASASGWHGGVVSERALADIREAYLMEGSADYAAQVARLEEAEAAERAKRAAEAQARAVALAAERAREEAARKAAEAKEAAAKAKREAEEDAARRQALAARVHARFAGIGITDTIDVSKILSVQGNLTTFVCTSTMPLVTLEQEGSAWREGDILVGGLPSVTILKPVVAPGTPFTATFLDESTRWRFDVAGEAKPPKSFVGRTDVGLVLGTPAYEEFAAYAARMAALMRQNELDDRRVDAIRDEIRALRRGKSLLASSKIRTLESEQDSLKRRIQVNKAALRSADSLLTSRYRDCRGRVLKDALGLSPTFGLL